jgi:hypothetical protein
MGAGMATGERRNVLNSVQLAVARMVGMGGVCASDNLSREFHLADFFSPKSHGDFMTCAGSNYRRAWARRRSPLVQI